MFLILNNNCCDICRDFTDEINLDHVDALQASLSWKSTYSHQNTVYISFIYHVLCSCLTKFITTSSLLLGPRFNSYLVSLRSWRYCVGARLKFWRRSRVPKKGTAPPSSITRLYYNGSAAKSHSTTTQYRQRRRLLPCQTWQHRHLGRKPHKKRMYLTNVECSKLNWNRASRRGCLSPTFLVY